MYFSIFILLINRKLLPLQQKYAQDITRETLFPQLENYPRTSNGLRFFLSAEGLAAQCVVLRGTSC